MGGTTARARYVPKLREASKNARPAYVAVCSYPAPSVHRLHIERVVATDDGVLEGAGWRGRGGGRCLSLRQRSQKEQRYERSPTPRRREQDAWHLDRCAVLVEDARTPAQQRQGVTCFHAQHGRLYPTARVGIFEWKALEAKKQREQGATRMPQRSSDAPLLFKGASSKTA